jgi:hypothetical protein
MQKVRGFEVLPAGKPCYPANNIYQNQDCYND